MIYVAVLAAGLMVVLHCTTIFHVLCYSFSSWGDGGVTLHNNISCFVTVSAAGVRVVLHCQTNFIFIYVTDF